MHYIANQEAFVECTCTYVPALHFKRCLDLNFWRIFFIIFTYIFGHRVLDLWPKVTNFNRVRASAVSNHLAKTASKSIHPFGWNFVHKNSGHTHTHRHTDKLQWKYNPSTISWRCNNALYRALEKRCCFFTAGMPYFFGQSLDFYGLDCKLDFAEVL